MQSTLFPTEATTATATTTATFTPYCVNQIPELKLILKNKVRPSQLISVTASQDLYNILKICFDEDTVDLKEDFHVLYLNKANKVIGWYKCSSGGITGTVADPRLILSTALLCNATSLALAHNHPSGNLKPSMQDEQLTARIKAASQYFDMRVLDHIIFTPDGYFSFADMGML